MRHVGVETRERPIAIGRCAANQIGGTEGGRTHGPVVLETEGGGDEAEKNREAGERKEVRQVAESAELRK